MCGIFGVVVAEGSRLGPRVVRQALDRLFQLSESRGKEAAGLALRHGNTIRVMKRPYAASRMIRTAAYRSMVDDALTPPDRRGGSWQPVAFIGHSRLVTDGLESDSRNNQPVVTDHAVGVHNGIIVNVRELWARFPDLKRRAEVDTEILIKLLERDVAQGRPVQEAARRAFQEIRGAASIAVLFDGLDQLLLATNTGSLYYCPAARDGCFIFASERYILRMLFATRGLRRGLPPEEIRHLEPGQACVVDLRDCRVGGFSLADGSAQSVTPPPAASPPCRIVDGTAWEDPVPPGIRRCARCVLPETFPFIEFDEHGVCNYCRNHRPYRPHGPEALREVMDHYRSRDGSPDCLVAFSGGRDSSYGLHYVRTVLGMKPLAFTYDWGMVTDLARRNQARICGKLGIEHILVSADIHCKRENIRRNILAWLRQPDLGMVPLFMAGDKQFYYYAHKLRQQNDIRLFMFCAGNFYETTDFKIGFCRIRGGTGRGTLTQVSLWNKLRLAAYYGWRYLKNPGYLNRSLLDTLFAFYSSYLMRDDYVYLYHYLRWDEEQIMTTLRREYDWETATDTDATWRIGDGTAPFYNYIYYIMAGFTENDTFRSNQVREGVLSRAEALRLVRQDNQPRMESLRWYADKIGFDWEEARRVIDSAPKLYAPVA
jgi:hypothetical protein